MTNEILCNGCLLLSKAERYHWYRVIVSGKLLCEPCWREAGKPPANGETYRPAQLTKE